MKDRLLGIATLTAFTAALYLAFMFAPTEATMGDVQRIFYLHVPAGITSYVAFLVVGVGSIAFLATRNAKWDRLAYCSAEVGVVFAAANIAMGMLWAKPVWGIWWTFDARLTLQLLLALIFVAYLMVGAYISDASRRAPIQAVVGILGSADVPINYLAIRIWRTQHPSPVIAGGEGSGLDADMGVTLAVAAAAVGLLYVYLLRMRLAVERTRHDVEHLEHAAAES